MADAGSTAPDAARAEVMALITAGWSTKVIHVAVTLGVPDRLAAGPRDSAGIAAETGSNPDALKRLLRALAVLGLCRQTQEDLFELTPAGALLRADAPGSIRGMALHWGERLWGALSQLDQSIETGRAWKASGEDGFLQMVRDPAQMAMFHQSMTDQTGPVARAMLDVYDFTRFRTLMDVGGSYGALLAAILKAHPGLQGRVFDLPGLAQASRAYLQGAGVAERAGFEGGSFFEAVPAGADAYMLKMIIHDWDDERSAAILTNCRKAAGASGKVLVMERIAPALAGTEAADYVTIRGDIVMLTATGGLERTERQYRELYAASGLTLERIVPTASGFCVMECSAA